MEQSVKVHYDLLNLDGFVALLSKEIVHLQAQKDIAEAFAHFHAVYTSEDWNLVLKQ
jgi:hypothetical protein